MSRVRGLSLGVLVLSCSTPPVTSRAPVTGVVVAAAEPGPPGGPAANSAPELPAVEPRRQALKSGEAYTVWGLSYSLRSRQHREAVTREPVVVSGYVVATNLSSAPACAVHPGGIADPEDCSAPMPAFWLGDRPNAPVGECVKVMGFASNYAQIYDAIQAMDRGEQYLDAFWGVEIPNPLPAAGARVAVTGKFGTTFSMAASGSEVDETMGIVTFRSMQTLEPANELATL
ncbi:MAG TPA: hypothetical protein VFU02_16190, partial [Polyangiaceae bacterium]|nr:hypothetical protein [Polyangiaceae bacterium]